jgi:hypothetical protein
MKRRVAIAIAPFGDLFVRKGSQAAGRIRKHVADGLRTGHHHRAVGRTLLRSMAATTAWATAASGEA